MMVKVRLLVSLVFVLVLLTTAAQAITYYDWNQTPGGAFSLPGDPNHTWDVCVYKPFNPWFGNAPYDWDGAVGDPEAAFVQGGTVPPEDPIVNQLFRNRTTSNWTDWHATMTNGTITPGSVRVYNDGVQSPEWIIQYTSDGFNAFTQPGSGTYVPNLGTLHVYFEYLGSGTVTFNQYPTTDAPVPEPASLAGLLSGLVALGFGIRRRR